MNATETRFEKCVLERRRDAGDVIRWEYEAIRFRYGLDSNATYTPDFLVFRADGLIEVIDVIQLPDRYLASAYSESADWDGKLKTLPISIVAYDQSPAPRFVWNSEMPAEGHQAWAATFRLPHCLR